MFQLEDANDCEEKTKVMRAENESRRDCKKAKSPVVCQKQFYIPSTCPDRFFNEQPSLEDDLSPLLDVSRDIELRSDDWPIDPDGDSEAFYQS